MENQICVRIVAASEYFTICVGIGAGLVRRDSQNTDFGMDEVRGNGVTIALRQIIFCLPRRVKIDNGLLSHWCSAATL